MSTRLLSTTEPTELLRFTRPITGDQALSSDQSKGLPSPRPRPPIAILGVPFDNVTTAEAIERIERMINSRRPHFLVTANVDFLVQAREDVELRRIFLNADLVLCDGTPLVWASRLLGNPLPERVAGADLVPLLIRVAAERRYRIFFLGATNESANQAVAKLKAAHPDLQIVGHYSPPFNKLLEMDHDEIKRRIVEAKPDLLFVCFGCPKQEKWIAMHYRTLNVPVSAGVGGTLDFLSGHFRRAPVWMRRSGAEWLFRLAQEPRRLCKRYVKDLWVFGWSIVAQWWRLQLRGGASGSSESRSEFTADDTWHRIRLPQRLDLAATRADSLFVDRVLADSRACLLDLAHTQFIDSTGIGTLIELQKKLRAVNRQLVLVSPTPPIRHALAMMRLEEFFVMAPDLATARYLVETRNRERSATVSHRTAAASSPVTWCGEITAANAEEVWEMTRRHMIAFAGQAKSNFLSPQSSAPAERLTMIGESAPVNSIQFGIPPSKPKPLPRELVIDLSAVRFIDSTGLGLMVRVRKLGGQLGIGLRFASLQPAVRNVVHMARLEPILLA